ncbi:P-loop containing nucleoside triphosphate hydrolase protein [Annulohypoxylon maeteangense]|uniref:P-loop containing nucleoside triphosphate hydrolase protein n=1 Tax=Annulohypoxylon maeteangense TaxID=1927788 RepID=UPI002008A0B3|nr:P-loop containing nucleoside triphosphate hydrolase protein [Annulohypoxylon maeteangense]KAI0888962.1 P-loop containing nucleoside triphosphate hydrolase protein [Annulohypoxylon maeteangense]
MAQQFAQLPPFPRLHPATPIWMKNTDTGLPLMQGRVAILENYLRETGTIPAKEQVLYGEEIGHGFFRWQDEPPRGAKHEHNSKGYDDAGYLVRKTSNGGNAPWTVHSIVVQSPHIMEILRRCLDGYPGVSPALDTIKLQSPFEPMFHRWGEFRRAIELADENVKRHIDGFVKVLEKELMPYFKILQDADKHGVIEYSHLWLLFGPNEAVWWDLQRNHVVGKVLDTYQQESQFSILCKQRIWDGFALQDQVCQLCVCPFTGSRPIAELNVVPLSRKPNGIAIREAVLKRGEKFIALTGCHYKEYLGLGMAKKQQMEDKPQWDGISGRIVVDAAMWDGKVRDRQKTQVIDPVTIDDSERLICSPLVRGYSLSKKKWYDLFVSNISDITWDNSFDRLVLGTNEKELLLGFAETKLQQSTQFDDVVAGKGNGVIILLAGPPGVGKTLTAESIADQMRVPLYPLSAGELGISPETVERQLYQALTLCQEWDAVLLLDEADVFLEKRNKSNLQRNELASIFLRLLEYFKGMMFLTTNRKDSIDVAFQSRIDLTIPFSQLSKDSRLSVWKNFIGKEAYFQDEAQGESRLRGLASHDMNGRQIKNVVKLAKMLATRRKQPLDDDHLSAILEMYKQD